MPVDLSEIHAAAWRGERIQPTAQAVGSLNIERLALTRRKSRFGRSHKKSRDQNWSRHRVGWLPGESRSAL